MLAVNASSIILQNQIQNSSNINPTIFSPNPQIYNFASPFQQKFPIPAVCIHYIIKNVKNLSVYLNLIQTCKHFFRANPVIVARKFKKKGDLCIFHRDLKTTVVKLPNGLKVTNWGDTDISYPTTLSITLINWLINFCPVTKPSGDRRS